MTKKLLCSRCGGPAPRSVKRPTPIVVPPPPVEPPERPSWTLLEAAGATADDLSQGTHRNLIELFERLMGPMSSKQLMEFALLTSRQKADRLVCEFNKRSLGIDWIVELLFPAIKNSGGRLAVRSLLLSPAQHQAMLDVLQTLDAKEESS